MCFSFAAKMPADTNHLKELREFLRVGNEDSAKRLIQTVNPSSVVDVGKVDFTKLLTAKGVEESRSKLKNGISKKQQRENTQGPVLSHNENHRLKCLMLRFI